MTAPSELPITIRPAYPDDRAGLRRLAELDSATVPEGPLLLAEVQGQIRVAISMADLRAIADPFFPTASVAELLKEHIRRGVNQPARRRRRLRKPAPALKLA